MKILKCIVLSLFLGCLTSASSFAAGTLVSAYTFDDSSGTTAADSIRGVPGDAAAFGGVSWVDGAIGGGVRLDGVDAWLSAENPIANGATAMSFSGWVSAESLPVWGSVVKNWGGSEAGQYHFGLQAGDGDISNFLFNADGVVNNIREGAAFSTNEWTHVAFTYDGTTHKLFKNGAKITEAAYSGALNFPLSQQGGTGILGIGVKTGNDGTAPDAGAPGYWNGSFDDFGFWDGALSESEVQSIYANGLNGISIVPEPSSFALVLLGCLSFVRRRRQS